MRSREPILPILRRRDADARCPRRGPPPVPAPGSRTLDAARQSGGTPGGENLASTRQPCVAAQCCPEASQWLLPTVEPVPDWHSGTAPQKKRHDPHRAGPRPRDVPRSARHRPGSQQTQPVRKRTAAENRVGPCQQTSTRGLTDAELARATDLALDDLATTSGLAAGAEADLLEALHLGTTDLELHAMDSKTGCAARLSGTPGMWGENRSVPPARRQTQPSPQSGRRRIPWRRPPHGRNQEV